MNIFRRLPLFRLLAICGLAVAVGAGAAALAFALGTGPTPPPRPLARAIHDALTGSRPEGFSANVQLTNHLLEGASLAGEGAGGPAGAGELTSSPLIAGGSGRIWISKEGKFRLELQSEQGDTEVVYDGHTLELYDAATNTLYRYTPPAREGGPHEGEAEEPHSEGVPSVAEIQQAIEHARTHAHLSQASPTDVGGQPAYTVSLSPAEGGSLLSSVALSFDADNGVPLRAAVYSTASSTPVLELAASEVSFAPVEASVFSLQPPANAKVHELKPRAHSGSEGRRERPMQSAGAQPKVTLHGKGPGAIAVLEQAVSGKSGEGEGEALRGLPQVKVDGAKASELRTALGTVLTFERGGVRYVLAGSDEPSALQALAGGL